MAAPRGRVGIDVAKGWLDVVMRPEGTAWRVACDEDGIAALVGVAPLNRNSGQWQGKGSCWGGRATVRAALSMPTVVAIRPTPQLRVSYERPLAAAVPKKVALVTRMRVLLTLLVAMFQRRTHPQTVPQTPGQPRQLPSLPKGQGGGETLDRGRATSPRARLRALLAQPGSLVVPFAYDALSARLIEAAGFEAVGISGSAVAASLLALPDVGLVSREETVAQARRIAGAVSIPVIADADTGYGGPLQAAHTARALETAGVAGFFIEDQQDPKRCGHLAGTRVVSRAEMLGKLRAVLKTRQDPDLVVIARTDALASEGVEGAAARARAYLGAGADLAFIAAPRSREELEALPRRVGGPLMVVLSEGGVTPLLSVKELGQMGYKIVGLSGLAVGAAARAVERALARLKAEGTTAGLLEQGALMPLDERNRLLRLEEYQALEEETAGSPAAHPERVEG